MEQEKNGFQNPRLKPIQIAWLGNQQRSRCLNGWLRPRVLFERRKMRPYGKETQMGYEIEASENKNRKSKARQKNKREAERQHREYLDHLEEESRRGEIDFHGY